MAGSQNFTSHPARRAIRLQARPGRPRPSRNRSSSLLLPARLHAARRDEPATGLVLTSDEVLRHCQVVARRRLYALPKHARTIPIELYAQHLHDTLIARYLAARNITHISPPLFYVRADLLAVVLLPFSRPAMLRAIRRDQERPQLGSATPTPPPPGVL